MESTRFFNCKSVSYLFENISSSRSRNILLIILHYPREIVSQDIQDFEYTPNSKYPGVFQVFNVENEEMLLKKFLQHIQVNFESSLLI